MTKCNFCECEGCGHDDPNCQLKSECKKIFQGVIWNFAGGYGCKPCADKHFDNVLGVK